MAALCFCGCGRKVKLPRRAFNSTGNLVRVQLEAWDESRPALEGVGLWQGELQSFVGTGEEMRADLLSISHGGPVTLRHPQKAMTQWLLRSREMLVELDAGETGSIGGGAEAPEAGPAPQTEPQTPPDARAARRAEIEAIRRSYEAEAEDNVCPDCGVGFDDQGAYLAHVASEHA